MGNRIIRNAAKCLYCEDTIESTYRHDCKSCSCGNVSVDGGKDYIKRSCKTGEWLELSEQEQDMIGDKYKLLRGMLGNPAGTEGYVFNEYYGRNRPGIQIIFPNGNYDGFSPDEQDLFLEFVGHFPLYGGYNFRNVTQVSKDFREGYWRF